MNIDMTMFHQTFFEEASDLIADFERELLVLEDQIGSDDVKADADENTERLNTIFRCAHSIKGGAATFGFADMAAFTHGLETLLDRVRNHEVAVDISMTQLFFESLDQLKSLLGVAMGNMSETPDSSRLSQRLEAAAASKLAPVPADAEEIDAAWGVFKMPVKYRLIFSPSVACGLEKEAFVEKLTEIGEVTSTLDVLDATEPCAPGLVNFKWSVEIISDWDLEDILGSLETLDSDSETSITEAGKGAKTDPVEASAKSRKRKAKPSKEQAPVIEASVTVAPAESPLASADAPPAGAALDPTPASGANANTAPPKTESSTLRVSTDKVDRLINLVGELVINQSMLNDVAHNFSMEKLPRLLEAIEQMERASRELQERVMAVRMLPIKHAFGRFPRLVRDTAAACGKQIDLRTTGDDTELDKTIIEAIADPLTHLVRNSIDHGLETPTERIAAGKPPVGVITLDALQEGGSIVVAISDDGRGLDREKIVAKAIERGLIGADETLSDDQIYDLIFLPGFSTASQVTDLSGRGVGMDIVKRTVQSLGGSVSVRSRPGLGSTFRIRLPLTVAILEGLSVLVGDEVYILPLTSIVESIQPKASDLTVIAGLTEVVEVRGTAIPVLRLYRAFGIEPRNTEPHQALFVIVETERKKVALLVDELISQSQVVIKSIETNYRKIDGVAGATILGDGRVAFILDVPGLLAYR